MSDENGKYNCPKCGFLTYERNIDWESGRCYKCNGEEDDEDG